MGNGGEGDSKGKQVENATSHTVLSVFAPLVRSCLNILTQLESPSGLKTRLPLSCQPIIALQEAENSQCVEKAARNRSQNC